MLVAPGFITKFRTFVKPDHQLALVPRIAIPSHRIVFLTTKDR